MSRHVFALAFLAFAVSTVQLRAVGAQPSPAPTASAMVLNTVDVDTRDIVRHVVPRDAIPALVRPKYDTVKDATYLRDDDRVIALNFTGQDFAYPTRILERHEIVNDVINGRPLLITY